MANKHKKLVTEKQRVLKLLTNEPTDLKKMILKMIIQASDYDELGYMDGRDPATGEIIPLLVGLEPNTEDGHFSIYPIARFYIGAEIPEFEPPDGRGNYISKSSDGEFRNDGEPVGNGLTGALAASQEESGKAEGIN